MRYFKLTILLILTINASGQLNNTMYFMPDIYQSRLLNPAYINPCKVYIGLPLLSSMYFNYANTNISVYKIFSERTETENLLVGDKFLKKLNHKNFISLETHLALFSLGIKVKDNFFSFDLTEKIDFHAGLPKDLLGFVLAGNSSEKYSNSVTKGLGFDFNYYREYSFGYSRILNDKLIVGAKAKVLFGKLNLYTNKLRISLITDPDLLTLTLGADSEINSSFPILIKQNSTTGNIEGISTIDSEMDATKILLNKNNPGFAIDLGAIYNYNENINFYASIIDIGLIRWRSNPNNVIQDGEIGFEGINILDLGSFNLQGFLDSLYNEFLPNVTNNKYSTFLPLKLYLGADYQLTKRINAGLVSRNVIYNRRIFPSATLSANLQLAQRFKTSLSYSMINRSHKNAGMAFYIGRQGLQFYLVNDNIYGLIRPFTLQNFDMRFGFNLIFGCRAKSKSSTATSTGPGFSSNPFESDSFESTQKQSNIKRSDVQGAGCIWIKEMDPDYIKKKKYLNNTIKRKKR